MTDARQAMDAHSAVARAVSDGSLTREPCEECGASETEAHHDDYSKPLDVRWLCASCHRRWHAKHPTGIEWPTMLSLRLGHDLYVEIQRIAARNDRSLSAEIRRALKKHVTAEARQAA